MKRVAMLLGLAVTGCSYDLVLLAEEGTVVPDAGTLEGEPVDGGGVQFGALLAYEAFDELGGLEGLDGGQGWSEPWKLQSVAEEGFVVVETNPLASTAFPGSARYLSGGDRYATASRRLDVEGLFTAWIDPADGRLGVAGTELWVSALLRRDENAFEQMGMRLTRGGYGGSAQVYRFGYDHRDGFWSVTLGAGETMPTSRPAVAGERLLWVAHLVFDAPQATVETFVMGEAQSTLERVHSGQVPRSEMTFDHVALSHGAFAGEGSTDEVRVGTTLEAVLLR